MRVLIVRLSSIGDVVHTMPLAVALQKAGHDVGWAVEPASAPLVRAMRNGPRVFVVPPAKGWNTAARYEIALDLRDFRPEIAIDAQGLWKSALWTRVTGAARTLGWPANERREPTSALLLRERATIPEGAVHMIDRHLALGAKLLEPPQIPGGRIERPAVDLEIPEAALRMAEDWAERGPFAAISPGGGWNGKLLPAEHWGQVAHALRAKGLASVILWGPDEHALAEEVVAASQKTAVLAPKTTLLELAAFARTSAVFLAADTGPLHIACAVGGPVVGLFGPTDPARNGPWNPDDVVVRREPPCAPCYKRDCPTHEGIMSRIPLEDILQAVDRRRGAALARPPA
jgi:ADP-heptose:LPS heptosyltransferase